MYINTNTYCISHKGKGLITINSQINVYADRSIPEILVEIHMRNNVFISAMLSFLQHCRELITEDVIRRLLAPLECTLTMLAQYVLFILQHFRFQK